MKSLLVAVPLGLMAIMEVALASVLSHVHEECRSLEADVAKQQIELQYTRDRIKDLQRDLDTIAPHQVPR